VVETTFYQSSAPKQLITNRIFIMQIAWIMQFA